MSKLSTLANQQKGTAVEFDYKTPNGSKFHADIRVSAGYIVVSLNGKWRGDINLHDPENPKVEPADNSIMNKKLIIQFMDAVNKEGSFIAPAWKAAILEDKLIKAQAAQIKYQQCIYELESI